LGYDRYLAPAMFRRRNTAKWHLQFALNFHHIWNPPNMLHFPMESLVASQILAYWTARKIEML